MKTVVEYNDNIITQRLITRFLTPDDAETWKEFFRDKEAIRFINTRGVTDIDQLAKNWIDRQLWRYLANKMGFDQDIYVYSVKK